MDIYKSTYSIYLDQFDDVAQESEVSSQCTPIYSYSGVNMTYYDTFHDEEQQNVCENSLNTLYYNYSDLNTSHSLDDISSANVHSTDRQDDNSLDCIATNNVIDSLDWTHEEAKRNWANEFDEILACDATSPSSALTKAKKLFSIARDFDRVATSIAVCIIEDSNLPMPDRRIRSISGSSSGIAGGEKYQCGNIFFKFSRDHFGIYGGDLAAMKAAGHELKALSTLLRTNAAGISFPLMATIDYLGFRVSAFAKLPISKNTLVYGSADQGRTIEAKDPVFNKLISTACAKIRIGAHNVGRLKKVAGNGELYHRARTLFGCADIEGHRVEQSDTNEYSKYYVVDAARLLPPVRELAAHSTFLEYRAWFIPAQSESSIIEYVGGSNRVSEALVNCARDECDELINCPPWIPGADPSFKIGSRKFGPAAWRKLIPSHFENNPLASRVIPHGLMLFYHPEHLEGTTDDASRINYRAMLVSGLAIRGPCILVTGFGTILYRLIRPELLKAAQCSLSSDAFSGFGGCSRCSDQQCEHCSAYDHKKIQEVAAIATSPQRNNLISTLASHLDQATISISESAQLVEVMHRWGLNLRYMGQLRVHTKSKWIRDCLLQEMIARTLRRMMYLQCQTAQIIQKTQCAARSQQRESFSANKMSEFVCTFLVRCFGCSPETDDLWRQIYTEIIAYYGTYENQKLEPEHSLCQQVKPIAILFRFCVLSGIKLRSSTIETLMASPDGCAKVFGHFSTASLSSLDFTLLPRTRGIVPFALVRTCVENVAEQMAQGLTTHYEMESNSHRPERVVHIDPQRANVSSGRIDVKRFYRECVLELSVIVGIQTHECPHTSQLEQNANDSLAMTYIKLAQILLRDLQIQRAKNENDVTDGSETNARRLSSSCSSSANSAMCENRKANDSQASEILQLAHQAHELLPVNDVRARLAEAIEGEYLEIHGRFHEASTVYRQCLVRLTTITELHPLVGKLCCSLARSILATSSIGQYSSNGHSQCTQADAQVSAPSHNSTTVLQSLESIAALDAAYNVYSSLYGGTHKAILVPTIAAGRAEEVGRSFGNLHKNLSSLLAQASNLNFVQSPYQQDSVDDAQSSMIKCQQASFIPNPVVNIKCCKCAALHRQMRASIEQSFEAFFPSLTQLTERLGGSLTSPTSMSNSDTESRPIGRRFLRDLLHSRSNLGEIVVQNADTNPSKNITQKNDVLTSDVPLALSLLQRGQEMNDELLQSLHTLEDWLGYPRGHFFGSSSTSSDGTYTWLMRGVSIDSSSHSKPLDDQSNDADLDILVPPQVISNSHKSVPAFCVVVGDGAIATICGDLSTVSLQFFDASGNHICITQPDSLRVILYRTKQKINWDDAADELPYHSIEAFLTMSWDLSPTEDDKSNLCAARQFFEASYIVGRVQHYQLCVLFDDALVPVMATTYSCSVPDTDGFQSEESPIPDNCSTSIKIVGLPCAIDFRNGISHVFSDTICLRNQPYPINIAIRDLQGNLRSYKDDRVKVHILTGSVHNTLIATTGSDADNASVITQWQNGLLDQYWCEHRDCDGIMTILQHLTTTASHVAQIPTKVPGKARLRIEIHDQTCIYSEFKIDIPPDKCLVTRCNGLCTLSGSRAALLCRQCAPAPGSLPQCIRCETQMHQFQGTNAMVCSLCSMKNGPSPRCIRCSGSLFASPTNIPALVCQSCTSMFWHQKCCTIKKISMQ